MGANSPGFVALVDTGWLGEALSGLASSSCMSCDEGNLEAETSRKCTCSEEFCLISFLRDSFSVAGFQEEAIASMMLHRPATQTNPDETAVLRDESMALFTEISTRNVVPFRTDITLECMIFKMDQDLTVTTGCI